MSAAQELTRKDFVPDAEPRWCPGCGDYAILNTIQKVFPTLGIPKENFVVVSGIGCSSRFPYYMNTYGFHTLHGRAPTVATGIKVNNPELSVWMVTGDGDGLSIGSNHLMHILRRNPDVNILLFNNRIYGLTKGQYSPTSEPGLVTKSSPMGSVEEPINPLAFSIAAQAGFVARTMDNNPKHMTSVFEAAAAHKGVSMIEIYQNCVIFNDKTFDPVYGRQNKTDQIVLLEDGKPMVFGKEGDKGIAFDDGEPKIVSADEAAVHDASSTGEAKAFALAQLSFPEFPTPMGVFRTETRHTYEDSVKAQVEAAIERKGAGDLKSLIRGSDFWEVKSDGEREVKNNPSELPRNIIDESIIEEELVEAEDRISNDPFARLFQTRIEEIIHHFGFSRGVSVQASGSVADAIDAMKRTAVSCILIQDGEIVVGILTERDVLFRVLGKVEDPEGTPISEVMTPTPDVLASWCTLSQALHSFRLGGYRHLPVVRENRELGIISIKGILNYLHKQTQS